MLDILKCFRTGLVAPSRTTYDTICILLNTDDEKERDELTKRWRDHKLEELNFVGIVVRQTCTTILVPSSLLFTQPTLVKPF